MKKHAEIRRTLITALKSHIRGAAFHDGRPVFIDEKELPAVAVYLSDARFSGSYLDAENWQATLHIEVFLSASHPDTALDELMDSHILPAISNVPELSSVIETLTPLGYDWQRDNEMANWGSADLTYLITYQM
ncbi:phage tail terminator protein [Pantoea sp. USHLN298]|uniref:phage tail terminator protein n=1 Tax=Pantoea sp. USHLN298 TaxID=3081294 RepID=UPI003015EC4A